MNWIRNLFAQDRLSINFAPEYGRLYFDHLYAEYRAVSHKIPLEVKESLDEIQQIRGESKLTWSDIYAFDLMLLDYLPPDSLVKKAFSLRAKYRSVAGQREYDIYIASKPPDLGTIALDPETLPETDDAAASGHGGENTKDTNTDGSADSGDAAASSPDTVNINVLALLRADIRYLLSELHLLYAVMPVREGLRGDTLYKVVKLMAWVIGLSLVIFIVTWSVPVKSGEPPTPLYPSTIVVVGFAGLIGGFVSVLQRIPSSPSEGDALFNLAVLTHGTWGIAVSPISGAIFAVLLFVLFAGNVLQGAIFPEINTIKRDRATATDSSNETPSKNANTQPSPVSVQTSAVPPRLEDEDETQNGAEVTFQKFLTGTRPVKDSDFALLIIWSFIAGFAERLVPDTLNRLVAKQQAIQGGNA